MQCILSGARDTLANKVDVGLVGEIKLTHAHVTADCGAPLDGRTRGTHLVPVLGRDHRVLLRGDSSACPREL